MHCTASGEPKEELRHFKIARVKCSLTVKAHLFTLRKTLRSRKPAGGMFPRIYQTVKELTGRKQFGFMLPVSPWVSNI